MGTFSLAEFLLPNDSFAYLNFLTLQRNVQRGERKSFFNLVHNTEHYYSFPHVQMNLSNVILTFLFFS